MFFNQSGCSYKSRHIFVPCVCCSPVCNTRRVLCVENMSVLVIVSDLLSASKQYVGFNETGFELQNSLRKVTDILHVKTYYFSTSVSGVPCRRVTLDAV
jgi:hypothetical protein